MFVVDQVLPEYETALSGTKSFPKYLIEFFEMPSTELNANERSELKKTFS